MAEADPQETDGASQPIDVGGLAFEVKSSPRWVGVSAEEAAALRQKRRRILMTGGMFLGLLMSTVARRLRPNNTLPFYQDVFFYVAVAGLLASFVRLFLLPDIPGEVRSPGSAADDQLLRTIPWYRKEPGPLTMVAALLLPPVSLALCLIVFTGDVYKVETKPHLKVSTWGLSNMIAAPLIVAIQFAIGYYVYTNFM
jgi:hypothetical protein